jgi:hypothetical protein
MTVRAGLHNSNELKRALKEEKRISSAGAAMALRPAIGQE